MRAVDVVIGVGWLAFWVYWLGAAVGVKAARTQWRRFAATRLVIVLVVLALVRIGAFREHATHDPWVAALGVAVFASGLGVAVWARICLGRNWGTPMTEKADPELVTSGPYRWVRNPIYSGLILAMVGTAMAVSVYWLVLAALLGCYLVYSALVEERFLAAQFPEQYAAYKRSTKMLVPFVF